MITKNLSETHLQCLEDFLLHHVLEDVYDKHFDMGATYVYLRHKVIREYNQSIKVVDRIKTKVETPTDVTKWMYGVASMKSLATSSQSLACTIDETTTLLVYQEPFSRPKGEKLWDYEIPTRIKSVWVNDISSLTQQTKDTKGKKKMLGHVLNLSSSKHNTKHSSEPHLIEYQLEFGEVMKVTPNEPSQLLRVEEKRKIELVSKKEVLRIINDEARASDLAIKNAEEFKQLQLQELNAAKEKQKAK
nr:hypothetical protein [Tanacetum cinerariifolium]